MRRALAQQDNAYDKTIPSPYGGWNARDHFAAMDETDAVLIENWYPLDTHLIVRPGYTSHSTNAGLTGMVKTLATFDKGTTQKLLAAEGGDIWDATSTSASSLGSGFASDVWQTEMFDGKMVLVNGTSTPQQYDGTTLSNLTITGVTSTTLIGCRGYQGRMYYWADNDQNVWYTALNTLGGAVTQFPLSRVATFGGELVTMERWSRDGGSGSDDYAVFIMSSGQVIVYSGTDPGTNFALVGIYKIAPPVGRRCAMPFGSDLVVITKDGYVSLTEVIDRRKPSVSDKIRKAVAEAMGAAALDGWQALHWAGGNLAVFNVPRTATLFDQHVVNLTTGAWTKFVGWNFQCFEVFGDQLYAGGLGLVAQAWDGMDDNGASIVVDCVPAFNMFKTSRRKKVNAVQIFFGATGNVSLGTVTETDWLIGPRPTPNLSVGNAGTPWGSPWGSPWGNELTKYQPWKSVSRAGRAVSARIVADVRNFELEWYATTYVYEVGGQI